MPPYWRALKNRMVLPERIETLLHRGEALAAELPRPRDGWRAWVWIKPMMKSGRTYAEALEEWTRTRVAQASYDGTISYFVVRYVELSEWHLDDRWYFDLDLAIKERPIVDKVTTASNQTELEHVLTQWLVDPTRLGSPSAADYPDPPQHSAA